MTSTSNTEGLASFFWRELRAWFAESLVYWGLRIMPVKDVHWKVMCEFFIDYLKKGTDR